MVTLLYNLPLLAQAATGEPSMLDGYVEVPFAWIGAVVGVIVMAGLVYYMRRLLTDKDEDQSARQARERGQRR